MGFRDLFKRLGDPEKRKEQGKAGQKVEPPAETQPPPSCNSLPSSDSAVVPRDLWDEAYEALRVENPELVQKYEQIIIEHGKEKTGSIEFNLGECRSQSIIKKYHGLIWLRVPFSSSQVPQAGVPVATYCDWYH